MTDEQSRPESETARITVHQAVGGNEFFVDLVDAFYDAVVDNDVLRPLYPEDLTESRRHTALFLAQYWGGPQTYSEERGHPRLRMRHMPFVIGDAERDAWVELMVDAVDVTLADPPAGAPIAHPDEGAEITTAVRAMLVDYFEHAATAMVNHRPDEPS